MGKGYRFEISILSLKKPAQPICSVRAKDHNEAERIAGECLGIDPLNLCAARICSTPRVRGMFVKAAK
jgi:hypothetical protein